MLGISGKSANNFSNSTVSSQNAINQKPKQNFFKTHKPLLQRYLLRQLFHTS